MKKEDELKRLLDKPDLKCLSGSRLYGTSTPESDWDYRGFVFPPFEYLIGFHPFKCAELEGDHKIHSANQFLNLVLKGDPQCTELLFAPEGCILEISERGKAILAMRDDVVSMAIFGRIMGYSVGEWRKAMAIQIVPSKRKTEKEDLINSIRNLYSPDKDSMDRFIEMLDSFDEKIEVSSTKGLGQKRREDVHKYGYCRKSAAHSIRLLGQLIELMETGKMTFPRPESDFLIRIRNGEFEKEKLQEMYDEAVMTCEKIKEKSVLPKIPNCKKVWAKYEKMVAEILLEDPRIKLIASSK